jgi:hypothetical protein
VFTPVKIVRFWLPALIFAVGLAMVVISPDIIGLEGAALMLGGGLGVVVSNRIHRMGLRGERDRDDEMSARAFMQKYGVWPDEASDDVLDRAELDGDIHPRGPRPGTVAAGPPPRAGRAQVGGSAAAGGSSSTAAADGSSSAAGGPSSADDDSPAPVRIDPHTPRKPASDLAPGTHSHAGGRRTERGRSRRPPRR